MRVSFLSGSPAAAIALVAAVALAIAVALVLRAEQRRSAALSDAALRLGLSFAPRDPELAHQPFLSLPVFQKGRRPSFRDVARGEGIWVFEHRYVERVRKSRFPRRQTVAAVRGPLRPGARSASESGWRLEGEGEWVVVYRRHRRVAPEDLATFVARARELAQRFDALPSSR